MHENVNHENSLNVTVIQTAIDKGKILEKVVIVPMYKN